MSELSTYLNKATELLYEYQWVYNFRATHLLVNGILSQIPQIWAQTLQCLSDDDLNLLTSGIVKDGWATCLIDFVHKCYEITLPSASSDHSPPSKDWETIPDKLRKGMSPKKQHEVLHLASFIYRQCNYSQLSRILDLGSGLGYLGKLLHHRSGYRVLGLEADVGHVGRAVKMQQPICPSGVNHVALTLNPAHRKEVWKTTVEDVRRALENQANWEGQCSCGRVEEDEESAAGSPDKFHRDGPARDTKDDYRSGSIADEKSMCMVSLHSCGDLSPTALRLFLKFPETKLLILLSCCYHKMKTLHVEIHVRGGGKVKTHSSSRSGGTADGAGESKGRSRKKPPDEAERAKEMGKNDGKQEAEGCRDRKRTLKGTRTSVSEDSDPRAVSLVAKTGKSKQSSSRKGGGKSDRKNKASNKGEREEEFFPDFPMSAGLKSLVSPRRDFLKRPLLRLASEITVEMWRLMTPEQHDEHVVHVLGRAVLELYAKIDGFKLKKKRRRGVRRTRLSNFDDYFEDALERFEFHSISEAEETKESDAGEVKGDPATPPEVSRVHLAIDEATEFAQGPSHSGRSRKVLQVSRRSHGSRRRVPSMEGSEGDRSKGFAEKVKNSETILNVVGVSFGDVLTAIPYADDDDVASDERHSEGDAPMATSEGTEPAASERNVPDTVGAVPNEAEELLLTVPIEVHRQRLRELTREHCTPEALRLTKALYALQAAIQSVAEGYILADRLAFLLEEGGCSVDASLVRVFDRSLSPRSLAIVARKSNCLAVGDK